MGSLRAATFEAATTVESVTCSGAPVQSQYSTAGKPNASAVQNLASTVLVQYHYRARTLAVIAEVAWAACGFLSLSWVAWAALVLPSWVA